MAWNNIYIIGSTKFVIKKLKLVPKPFLPENYSNVMSHHVVDITSRRVMSQNVISRYVTSSRHITNLVAQMLSAMSVSWQCRVMSFHVISCHFMSFHVMSCHATSRHVTPRHTMPRHSMSGHVMSCHVMSRPARSRHVTSCYATSCHVMSRHFTSSLHVTSRRVTSCHVTSSCHAMPRHFTSCHVTSHYVTSCSSSFVCSLNPIRRNIYTPTSISLLYNPFTIVLHKRLSAYLFRAAHTPARWKGTKRNKDFHPATPQPIGNEDYWPNPSRMWI